MPDLREGLTVTEFYAQMDEWLGDIHHLIEDANSRKLSDGVRCPYCGRDKRPMRLVLPAITQSNGNGHHQPPPLTRPRWLGLGLAVALVTAGGLLGWGRRLIGL